MPVDSNWTKTIKIFAKELKRKNVTEDHITMICDVADINAVRILELIQEENEKENNSTPQTQAEIIIEIAEKVCKQFFHDQFKTAYAAIALDDHTEVISLDNKRFKNYICGIYYETDKNQAQITSDFGGDTGGDTDPETNIPPPKDSENYAQIIEGGSRGDRGDTLHTIKGPTKGTIYRLGDSDLFGRKDCNVVGDSSMEYHDCSGWKK